MTEEKGTEIVEAQPEVADLVLGYEGSEAYQRQRVIIKHSADWAAKMTDAQIDYVCRRSYALGVDPMNKHEIHWYPDNKGKVQFQWAYQLIEQYVAKFHGAHTMPKYRELDEQERMARGLNADDHAVEVLFFMQSDLPKVYEAAASGVFDAQEAREMYAMRGIGTANAQEWDKWFFAPNGRDKRWKIEKRAVTDALMKRFGAPSRAQVIELRRDLGHDQIQPGDWEDTGALHPSDAVALAKSHAQERQAPMLSEEDRKTAAAAMFGGRPEPEPEPRQEEDVQDGDFTVVEDAAPPAEPEPPVDPLDEHFPRAAGESAGNQRPKSQDKPQPWPEPKNIGEAKTQYALEADFFRQQTGRKIGYASWPDVEKVIAGREILVGANAEIRSGEYDVEDLHSRVGQALAQI